VARADVHLFAPETALRTHSGGFFMRRGPFGQNPPNGAVIDYYLRSAPAKDQELTLEILDNQNKLVRKFTSKPKQKGEEGSPEEEEFFGPRGPEKLPAEAGLNRFVWDLRYEGAHKVPHAVFWGSRLSGPLALPGAYQVRLTLNGKSYSTRLKLDLDPRITTSRADLQKQFDLLLRIRDRVSEAHDAVNQIRDLRGQLDALEKHLGENSNAQTIKNAALQLDKKMTGIEDQIIQAKSKAPEDPLNYPIMLTNQLADLGEVVASADSAPTQQSYQVFDYLNGQLQTQLAAWKQLQSQDVVSLNDMIRQEQIPVLVITGGAAEGGGQ
jgi:hypothetical protein